MILSIPYTPKVYFLNSETCGNHVHYAYAFEIIFLTIISSLFICKRNAIKCKGFHDGQKIKCKCQFLWLLVLYLFRIGLPIDEEDLLR